MPKPCSSARVTPFMPVERLVSQRGLSPVCGAGTMYPESHQISGGQFGAVVNDLSQSGPLPQTPQDCNTITSLHVTGSTPRYTLPFLDSPVTEEWVDIGNPAPTLSAPLAQDYDAVTFPDSATFYHWQSPGAPETFLAHSTITSLDINGITFDSLTPGAPQVNSTTPPAATTPRNPKQCPVCQAMFRRWQECDRHLLSYLPHWIHCPLPHCSWRGNRVTAFKQHWQRRDHRKYYESYGCSPGQERFEIYDPQEFVDQIKAGTIPVSVVAGCALFHVSTKALQLQKPSMSANLWGYTLKRAPQ
ncbi:hypothetical protein BJY52DRAFT_74663 [Lactarius psammicola]|nr:hypothetical protein BJY52DRAFT_74663 [Lactarius psammicola]